ncbi:MAG TPA: 6-pyruvoyl-tetrahydropterin synthase-related protein, partial [Anaerolineae bacterium]|nr:6-pyruvoyl-tetrahydropterin synthase-related protein [Anaerolineae bacterium]
MKTITSKLYPYRYLLTTILIATLAAQPLFGLGLLNTRGGGDSPFLLQRLHQLVAMLYDGNFPVRWMPDANYGHGYPFFHYYAPLSLYITALFKFTGFAYTTSIQLSQLTAFIVAALGTYALLRQWQKPQLTALLAAAAYTIAPFHLVNVYVRGDSLAEFWAMAFYPLILLTADRYLLQPDNRRLALNALSYTALILSHQISAMIFSPFYLLYLLLGHFCHHPTQRHQPLPWLRTILPILLGFALSAWFFVPALAATADAQLTAVTDGYFHYSNHFRGFDLTQTSLLFDFDVAAGGAFRMSLPQTLLATLGLLTLLYTHFRPQPDQQPSHHPHLLITLALCFVATFMITPLSAPLWRFLPLLDFTQFPWRFLSVQALGTSLLIASLGQLPRPQL